MIFIPGIRAQNRKVKRGPGNSNTGYRLYFVKRGLLLIILLCGGDKKSQKRDIRMAKTLAKVLKD